MEKIFLFILMFAFQASIFPQQLNWRNVVERIPAWPGDLTEKSIADFKLRIEDLNEEIKSFMETKQSQHENNMREGSDPVKMANRIQNNSLKMAGDNMKELQKATDIQADATGKSDQLNAKLEEEWNKFRAELTDKADQINKKYPCLGGEGVQPGEDCEGNCEARKKLSKSLNSKYFTAGTGSIRGIFNEILEHLKSKRIPSEINIRQLSMLPLGEIFEDEYFALPLIEDYLDSLVQVPEALGNIYELTLCGGK